MPGPRLRLVLVLLVLSAFTLTVLDTRDGGSPFGALRRGTDAVLGPVVDAAAAGVRALPGGGQGGDQARLQRENDDLRRQVLALQGDAAQAAELADLRRLRDAGPFRAVVAQVVGYGSLTPFETTVTIDVGSRDGVAVDQTVTSGRGLVGRTVRVGRDTSTVALLTDPTVSVGARLDTAPRSFGLTTGLGRGGLRLALVEPADPAALAVGDAVVTGGSDTYAAGVPIGQVTALDPAGAGVVPTATVRPYADLGSLDLLQVVVQDPRGQPRAPLPPS